VVAKDGAAVFRCSLSGRASDRRLEIPAWIDVASTLTGSFPLNSFSISIALCRSLMTNRVLMIA
jgi:hypothetical protein